MSGSNNIIELPAASAAGTPRPIKILALCDSPTAGTGFARVARNVLGRWATRGKAESGNELAAEGGSAAPGAGALPNVEVHCWGIGFEGWDYDQVPYLIMPGGGHDWRSPQRLSQFLNILDQGGYSHVWMMMDPDALGAHGFAVELRKVCKARGVRSMLYFPIDAPVEPEWLAILQAVDVAVSYTEYGRAEVRRALGKSLYPIEVVPHGVDACFRPFTSEQRMAARKIELKMLAGRPNGKELEIVDFCQEDTFLMLNVNKNEWRKDPLRSLEILVALRSLGMPAKLILRMDNTSALGGTQLDLAAKQLGLTYGKEWCYIGPVPDDALAALYNAADLYLTTSMGEGWGLGVTEAMACHCPVACAQHTSLGEIGQAESGQAETVIWLPMEDNYVCGNDTRLRRRVAVKWAAMVLHEAYGTFKVGTGVRRAPAAGALKSWDWVAEAMLGLLLNPEAKKTNAALCGGAATNK